MSNVIPFPGLDEREWRGIEEDLRSLYRELPGSVEAWDSCLPHVKQKCQELFPAFSITSSHRFPGQLSEEQLSAIQAAIDADVQKVVSQLRKERAAALLALAVAEFRASYALMYGSRA